MLAVLTEWDEFRWLDFDKVGRRRWQRAAIVDARNLLDPPALRRRGFAYDGIGRVLMATSSSSPAAPASSARTSAARCSTRGDEVVCVDNLLTGAVGQHRRPRRRRPGSRSSTTTSPATSTSPGPVDAVHALRQPGVAAPTSRASRSRCSKVGSLGTHNTARPAPRTRAPASSWRRPARCTATRWCTPSRRRTGATSTPSARAASTTRPSASPRR